MNIDTQKKILFLDAYYEPEKTAYTHLEKDLIQGLVNSGFDITIICPQPTRNVSKEQHKAYNRTETKYDGKVTIKRFKCVGEKKSVLLRALRYVFASFKTYRLAKKEIGIDYIFCNSTPPIQGLVASNIKRFCQKHYKKNVIFIYNLQDLFPDSMVSAGITRKDSLIYKIGKKIEKKIYSNADHIITISNSFRDNLLEKKVNNEKISVIYNWIDLDNVKPIERDDNVLFDKLGIDRNAKIVCYAGNFGFAQDVDAIERLVSCCKDDSIKFVFFGGGSLFKSFSDYVEHFNNVYVFPLMPQNLISEVYSIGDLYLISCKKGLGNSAFPSKIWPILACNKYIIGLYDVDSEVDHFLNDNKCGMVVDQGNVESQFEAIYSGFTMCGDFRSISLKFGNKKNAVQHYVNVFLS